MAVFRMALTDARSRSRADLGSSIGGSKAAPGDADGSDMADCTMM